jgi:hypothetical protein
MVQTDSDSVLLGDGPETLSDKIYALAPIIDTESGSIISINNNLDSDRQIYRSLISTVEPVQSGSGEPSITNVRSISGWDVVEVIRANKNILSRKDLRALPYTSGGVTFADIGDGKISITGTAGTTGANLSMNNYSVGKRTFLPAGTYTLSGLLSGTGAKVTLVAYKTQESAERFLATDINDTVKERTFTVEQDCYYGCYFSISKNTTVDAVVSPILEVGSVATAYEPYYSETLTMELPETVYGGSLDWNTGTLTVNKEKVVIDGINLKIKTVYQTDDGIYYASLGLPNDSFRTNVTPGNPMSDKLVANSRTVLGGCYITGSGNHTLVVTLPDQTLTTVDSMNEWLSNNPITIVYTIAKPYTIQLESQQLTMLAGINNVWSSTGSTELSYAVDPKTYIDNKFNELQNAILALGGNL